jgi:CHASE1-domain containing sensor protein
VSKSLNHLGGVGSSATSESLDAWIKSVGDISAPVLAGFSVTVVIVVSDNAGSFRWPGWAILALTVAAIALIATLQCARHALKNRWPRADEAIAPKLRKHIWYLKLTPGERAWFWRRRTRNFYHSGLTALLAGLALTLAPPSGAREEGVRWLASGLAFVACLIEAFVFLVNSYSTDDQAETSP